MLRDFPEMHNFENQIIGLILIVFLINARLNSRVHVGCHAAALGRST